VLAALALYARLLPALAREWAEFPSLSHGFAIPVIATYLLWAKRDRLRAASIRPSWWGLPPLLLGLGGFVVGMEGAEPFIARISLPVTLLGLVLFVAGWQVFREAWIGVAYLAFMVPLPYATLKLVTYRSRLLDASIVAQALTWLGVPVLHDGVMLHLANISLEVADDCSSIPAIAALASLGVAYASLANRTPARRLLLVIVTPFFAIGANIFRITTTALAAYYIGRWTLGTAYHQFNGTVTFILTFALLLLFDTLLSRLARVRGR
jgi:exosortase